MNDIDIEATVDRLFAYGLHEIVFRNAGVACCFYEGPDDIPNDWRRHLHVYKYYPTFLEALQGELNRLGLVSVRSTG